VSRVSHSTAECRWFGTWGFIARSVALSLARSQYGPSRFVLFKTLRPNQLPSRTTNVCPSSSTRSRDVKGDGAREVARLNGADVSGTGSTFGVGEAKQEGLDRARRRCSHNTASRGVPDRGASSWPRGRSRDRQGRASLGMFGSPNLLARRSARGMTERISAG
jgi:hypothetical protein